MNSESFMLDGLHTPGRALVSGVILAGGESRRMGYRRKALLEIGGKTLIERVAEILRSTLDEVVVITNSPSEFAFLGLPMFPDIRRGRGSLGGLYTGLSSISRQYGFLVACDMPFLRKDVASFLVGLAGGHDVVIPRIHGLLEPLHALYSRSCIPFVEELLDRGDLKILKLFDRVTVRVVAEEELALFDRDFRFIININTPEELEEARRLIENEHARGSRQQE